MFADEKTGCTCYDETTRRCTVHSGEKVVSITGDWGEKGFSLKDSGDRREFPTGAVRDMASDKERPDLISPFALRRVGRWLGMGAKKYGERNWEKGMPLSVFYASLIRHALKWAMGWRDEDHMAAVIFNAQAIIHFEETGRADLDDMPHYQSGPAGSSVA
ncbi:MAG: dATP/dGTP diphosphohydrolase domain-containing protein [Bryobacteraceae bacterium]